MFQRQQRCELCSITLPDDASLRRHLEGRKHREQLRRADVVRSALPASLSITPSHSPAGERLKAILSLHYGSPFAVETVSAMFLLRTDPLITTRQCPLLSYTNNSEEYAQRILTVPDIIRSTAEKARCRLASTDLPEFGPSLVLLSDVRRALQYDCLYRMFLATSLIKNLHLLHILVTWCITQQLATGILYDLSPKFWVLEIADNIYRTSLVPGSWLHRHYHQWSDTPTQSSRTRSASDPESRTAQCNCLPPVLGEELALADLYRQLQKLNSGYGEEIGDEDVDDEALLEDEVDGDMDEEPA